MLSHSLVKRMLPVRRHILNDVRCSLVHCQCHKDQICIVWQLYLEKVLLNVLVVHL